ncbi:hypothetical protein JTE90_022303 [Oedothorax gibbosus]|uniref:Uncharacterized protein n=1 Tax=Oedothorax gibbosus TaxID=931172 RepID=A0AAV6VVM4_9ARAC|nr:hypothetical protein JTE90_022303 [Oedothorax gibbosus]
MSILCNASSLDDPMERAYYDEVVDIPLFSIEDPQIGFGRCARRFHFGGGRKDILPPVILLMQKIESTRILG